MDNLDDIQRQRTDSLNAKAAEVFTLSERLGKANEDASAAATVISRFFSRRAEPIDVAVALACLRNVADGALKQMPEEVRAFAEDKANQLLEQAIAGKRGGR